MSINTFQLFTSKCGVDLQTQLTYHYDVQVATRSWHWCALSYVNLVQDSIIVGIPVLANMEVRGES